MTPFRLAAASRQAESPNLVGSDYRSLRRVRVRIPRDLRPGEGDQPRSRNRLWFSGREGGGGQRRRGCRSRSRSRRGGYLWRVEHLKQAQVDVAIAGRPSASGRNSSTAQSLSTATANTFDPARNAMARHARPSRTSANWLPVRASHIRPRHARSCRARLSRAELHPRRLVRLPLVVAQPATPANALDQGTRM